MLTPEIEALIRQEVAKQVRAAASNQSFTADEYDIQACPANVHPGKGWQYVSTGSVGIHIIIVWRKLRSQVDTGKFFMPLT